MIGLLTALSLMWAIWGRAPANIERYLWAELIEIPFMWVVHFRYGDWSMTYAVTYVLFTGLILWQICHITLDCLRNRQWRLRAAAIGFILAVTLARAAYLEMAKPVELWGWISLAEGAVLAWAGILTSILWRYTKNKSLYFALALLWIVQSWYSLGWVRHGHLWDKINWLVPPSLCILCFSWLAYRLRAVPVEA